MATVSLHGLYFPRTTGAGRALAGRSRPQRHCRGRAAGPDGRARGAWGRVGARGTSRL